MDLSKILECKKCSLHKTRTKVVPGEGNTNSNIVLIGECPGPDEDKVGRPFIGRAGKLLRSILESMEIDTDKIYITNIVRCFPYSSLNPSKEHIDICSSYLSKQLELMKPKLIVSLGKHSSQFFLGEIKITKETGRIRRLSNSNTHILPVVHPSYVMRGYKKVENYVLELMPILEFYNG